jgi:hypothetical protein
VEEAFKAAVVGISEGLTPDHLRRMAEDGLTLAMVMDEAGLEMDSPPDPESKAVKHLQSLSDEYLFGLLEDVVPEHAKVIDQYPGFKSSVIHDLRVMAGAPTNDLV